MSLAEFQQVVNELVFDGSSACHDYGPHRCYLEGINCSEKNKVSFPFLNEIRVGYTLQRAY